MGQKIKYNRGGRGGKRINKRKIKDERKGEIQRGEEE